MINTPTKPTSTPTETQAEEKKGEKLELEKQKEVISPVVAAKNKKPTLRKLIFIGAGVIIVLYFVFFGHRKPKEEEGSLQQSQAPIPTNSKAPNLPLTNDQVAKLEAAVDQISHGSQSDEEAQAAKLEKMRMVSPVQVYAADGSNINVGGMQEQNNNGANGVLGGGQGGDANTQFMNKVSNSKAPIEKATRILHPDTTLAQGTMIWATLETRIVSDLPGMLRAITSEDIYSEDGSNLLLPRGSKLIGQYTSGIAQGQRRVFVVWQRAIRPDHIDIQLGSPGTDALGAAGLGADNIDRHFWEQFGDAILLSIIGASAANAGVNSDDQYNSSAAYRQAIADSFSQTAQSTLQTMGSIKPTLYVDQGRKISVFVARDLDFYDQLNGQ
jgi:type IV secretion system protein VirB10